MLKTSYGHTLSTVFGSEEKKSRLYAADDDDDPVMANLRSLDYRYVRFCFHPLRDKFVLSSDWKDPNWTDLKSMKLGLDSEERYRREQVFDKNIIDIEEKGIMQLLVDEVSQMRPSAMQSLTCKALHPFYIFQVASLILWSLDQYYYYAICIFVISLVSITSTLIETRAVSSARLLPFRRDAHQLKDYETPPGNLAL